VPALISSSKVVGGVLGRLAVGAPPDLEVTAQPVTGEVGRCDQDIVPVDDDHLGVQLGQLVILVLP
jgi:hypothetical protein